MSRLFVGVKDIQFINDTVKELVKDVVGQKIYYYAISTMKTYIHPVYGEAVKKIFEPPVVLNIIAGQPAWEKTQTLFAREATATVEMLVQARDLIDKGLKLNEGDYFTYGDVVYEVVSFLNLTNIYGQEEYDSAFKLVGKMARLGEFNNKQMFNPTKDGRGATLDELTGIQSEFVQQRGLSEDKEGNPTGDVRQMRERLGEDMALPVLGEQPKGNVVDETRKGTRFIYDE